MRRIDLSHGRSSMATSVALLWGVITLGGTLGGLGCQRAETSTDATGEQPLAGPGALQTVEPGGAQADALGGSQGAAAGANAAGSGQVVPSQAAGAGASGTTGTMAVSGTTAVTGTTGTTAATGTTGTTTAVTDTTAVGATGVTATTTTGGAAETAGAVPTTSTAGQAGVVAQGTGGASSDAVNMPIDVVSQAGAGGSQTTDDVAVTRPVIALGSGPEGTLGGPVCVGGPGRDISPETPASLAECARHVGPTFDQFFDLSKLATLRIEIPEASLEGYAADNWVALMWSKWTHCDPFSPVNVQMTYESPDGVGNATLDNVAMRFRGSNGEGTNVIQGFKLDVQTLDTAAADGKRRFADLNRINMLSIERDDSHMVPCLAYNHLRAAGIPAPRCNHLKVYVNGAYYGLMENVEQVNDGYTRRHFGSSAGSLYAGSPSQADCPNEVFRDSAARFIYIDDLFSSYADQYQLQSATSADAELDLIPMLKCGDETQTPDDATFRQCISEWVDVHQWLRQIAAESVMPSLEAMIGYYRNFYVYFAPEEGAPHGGRFKVWSWDLDNTFHRQGCAPSDCDVFTSVASFFGARNQRAPLIQRLTTVFHAEYCEAVQNFVTGVMNPTLLDAMAAVVKPGLVGEPSVTEAAWQAEVDEMRAFIISQAAVVQLQLDAQCL